MPTMRAIVATALRKLGRVGGGRDPRPSDMTDAMDALKSLYRGWINSGAFGRLEDVVPLGDYIARGNERIYRTADATFDVTLPELVVDERGRRCYYGTVVSIAQPDADTITINTENAVPLGGHVTTPRDLSVVVITDAAGGQTVEWIYDGWIKQWVRLDLLEEDDDAPLSLRDSNGLASCLAVNLSDQWGADVAPATALSAAHFRSALVTRFGSVRPQSAGVYF